MTRIITIGREFGSGGRELGRRLAEALGCEYYDREIITQIAAHTSFSEEYVRQVMEGRAHRLYPITVGSSFSLVSGAHADMVRSVFEAQVQTLRELAELSDCVIVGCCADYLLREQHPFRLFVYAEMDSRVQRCLARGEAGEKLSEAELRKRIRRVDRDRARFYADCTGRTWGDRLNYELCVNTTGCEIKEIVPALERLIRAGDN